MEQNQFGRVEHLYHETLLRFRQTQVLGKLSVRRNHLLAGFAPMVCLSGRQDLSALIKRIATLTGIESIGTSVCKRAPSGTS
jgi:hypothetical protein